VIRQGEPWGQPHAGPAELEVAGDDHDLAAAVGRDPGRLVRFLPSAASDLGRAVGLGGAAAVAPQANAVPVDALRVDTGGDEVVAVNAVVVGPPPDRLAWRDGSVPVSVLIDGRSWFEGRATTVLVASGQHLRGLDVVPRGHPGDGWAEVQVYALGRAERTAMRLRLRSGTHVPHPRIRQGRARRVELRVRRPRPIEVDGQAAGRSTVVAVTLVPGALRLLV
jgi:hypothetical protein